MKAEEFDATLKKSRRDLRSLCERLVGMTVDSDFAHQVVIPKEAWEDLVYTARQTLKDLGARA